MESVLNTIKTEYFDNTVLNKQLMTAFHDKSPKGKIFFNAGAANGAYLRKEMGYNPLSVDNWIEQGADGCRGFLSSQISDAIGDLFHQATIKTNTSLENAFVCWSATFKSIIDKKNTSEDRKSFILQKSEQCISRYTAITCDLDYKDLSEEQQKEFGIDGYKFWNYIKTTYIDTYLIPLPTFVNASGRGGLHLIWVLENSIPNNYNNRKNINLIYQAFYYIQTILPGTDRTCMPDHWLRVPGSLNQKKGLYYQCKEIFYSGEYTPLQVWYDIICATEKDIFDPMKYNKRCPFEYMSKKDIKEDVKNRKEMKAKYEELNMNKLSDLLTKAEHDFTIESFENDNRYIDNEIVEDDDIIFDKIDISIPTSSGENKLKKNNLKKTIIEQNKNDGWYHFTRNNFIVPFQRVAQISEYHYTRLRDFADLLVNSRDNKDGAYRELILFHIAVHSCWYYDSSDIEMVINNVRNTLFIICDKMKNPLIDDEINHIIDMAIKYYIKGKNFELTHNILSYERFRLKSHKYIELFKITSDEVKHLRSVITKEEAYIRKQIRNKKYYKTLNHTSKKDKILSRQKQIALYIIQHPTCTNSELINIFNISKRTLQNDKKAIKENNITSIVLNEVVSNQKDNTKNTIIHNNKNNRLINIYKLFKHNNINIHNKIVNTIQNNNVITFSNEHLLDSFDEMFWFGSG